MCYTRFEPFRSPGAEFMIPARQDAAGKSENYLENYIESAKAEIETIQREIKEIALLIQQSRSEVERLTQRNAASTGRLQQLQDRLESLPRSDIRHAYESALEDQQRLFVMRGQLDKLHSDQNILERYQTSLETAIQFLVGVAGSGKAKRSASGASHTVEMVIQAQESERQRLARQMHDGPAQALTNLILQTDIAMRLFDRDPAKAKEELESLKNSANSTFQKVRNFITDLRPMMLDDLGLAPTLNRYVQTFQEQNNIDVRMTTSGLEQRLEAYVEVMLFRAVQELLTNAVRHSGASQVKLQVDAAGGEVRLSMDDNGKGFDVTSSMDGTGMGLKVIRDRVELLGGEMEIDSVLGQGTRIVFTIPIGQKD